MSERPLLQVIAAQQYYTFGCNLAIVLLLRKKTGCKRASIRVAPYGCNGVPPFLASASVSSFFLTERTSVSMYSMNILPSAEQPLLGTHSARRFCFTHSAIARNDGFSRAH